MVSSCGDSRRGTRILDPAKENIPALESLNRYIVGGCWELKRKFRLICSLDIARVGSQYDGRVHRAKCREIHERDQPSEKS